MTNLGIWQEVRATQGGMPAWLLKSSFKENLFSGIFEPNRAGSSGGVGGGIDTDEFQIVDPKMIEKLDSYGVERWEV